LGDFFILANCVRQNKKIPQFVEKLLWDTAVSYGSKKQLKERGKATQKSLSK
jgi:hypothetical protein